MIKIGDNEYKFKYTLRALFIFEQITNKAFNIETLTDNYVFLFSMLLANNPDMKLTFEEFIEAFDENPELFEVMTKAVEESQKKNKIFESKDKESGEKKS